ncbi:MAG: hypothetical protein E7055_21170 [Lentisphaerae bacterium]|nr:hypothetical protein [Lentisphaerota bacterium]
MEILESQNKEHGFFGTTAVHCRRTVEAKWETAFSWVAAAMPSWSPENIRDYLDGRPGRYLADELHDCGNIALIDQSDWLRSMYEFALEVGIADKTPALDLRIQADAEIRKAEDCIRKAEKIYIEILNRFPSDTEDAYVKALKEHAVRGINMANFFFGGE